MSEHVQVHPAVVRRASSTAAARFMALNTNSAKDNMSVDNSDECCSPTPS
eukprot:m.1334974 g.1334974  ORF g.1334974 m.1334974 type:complete len:50 (+) comp24877_c0_seq12:2349-2498(+)